MSYWYKATPEDEQTVKEVGNFSYGFHFSEPSALRSLITRSTAENMLVSLPPFPACVSVGSATEAALYKAVRSRPAESWDAASNQNQLLNVSIEP
jgi:hypothetical protein